MNNLSTIEIISGIALIVASIFIILVVLLQDSKEGGLTSAVGGGMNDSFFGKNGGRTKDAKLSRITKIMAAIFFIVTLVVNIITSYS